ncbi:hypothetical protein B5P45_10725 [Phyllobacterium zundukense]|uniref:Kazal-like domain-containing protein n=3 Tax=Phyllobacterium zundukense TaxID=1867719 RepID=A0A2N9VZC0_9HYPH|nr:hypothetical protein B5P45_10725 [Phyllobacterium zundukense]
MQAQIRNFLKIAAVMAVTAIVASCTVAVEDGGPHYPRPDRPERPQFCTREYAPVCGVRGSVRQTFGNACEARSRDFRIVGSGECSYQDRPGGGWSGQPGRPDRPDRPGGPGQPYRPEEPRMCTQQYAPVCARRGNSVQSFGNACEAGNAGYRVIGEGRC